MTLSKLIESVDIEDEKGHLYVVDIEFDHKNATQTELTCNEIYPPITEKQKVIDACERSTYQLLEQLVMGEKGPNSYKKLQNHMQIYFKNSIYRYI